MTDFMSCFIITTGIVAALLVVANVIIEIKEFLQELKMEANEKKVSNLKIVCTFVLCIIFLILLVCGWVMNIVKIIDSDFANITVMLAMRCISVFVPPLGSILGYF